ncbi:MAG: hypothetical protein P9X24_06060 [Candidatus Hatepunaea meridiana]|nr:hypothetical protein [Candidatus Hatepunaea meridiana]
MEPSVRTPFSESNIDLKYLNYFYGDITSINQQNPEDYYSVTEAIMPLGLFPLEEGDYHFEMDDLHYSIHLFKVNSENDPVFKASKDIRLGSGSPEMTDLPIAAFLDNRAIYPALMIRVVFPFKLDNWADHSHPSGIKVQLSNEYDEILGGPFDSDKIAIIAVLNKFLSSDLYPLSVIPLTYSSFSNYVTSYLCKTTKHQLLLKLSFLTNADAYRNALYDYLGNASISHNIDSLGFIIADTPIHSESDLHTLILNVIDKTLRHYIEDRRWIQPFWQTKSIMESGGSRIERIPKPETEAQPTLFVIFELVLRRLGVHVIRESNEGIGELDFRFSYTTPTGIPLNVIAEFKYAHSQKVEDGIRKQLPAYLRSVESKSGIFVQFWFKDTNGLTFNKPHDKTLTDAVKLVNDLGVATSEEQGFKISCVTIDASHRPSASQL